MRGIVGGASFRGRPYRETFELCGGAARHQPKLTKGLSWLRAGEEREKARLVDGAENRQVQVASRGVTDGTRAVRASGMSRLAADMQVVGAKGNVGPSLALLSRFNYRDFAGSATDRYGTHKCFRDCRRNVVVSSSLNRFSLALLLRETASEASLAGIHS